MKRVKKSEVVRFVSAVAVGATVVRSMVEMKKGKHLIVWKNDDGKVIGMDEVDHGMMPHHAPIEKIEEGHEYYFVGWHPKIEPATANTAYRARFLEVDRENGAIPFRFFDHVTKENIWSVTYYSDDYFDTPATGYNDSLTTFALCLELSSGNKTLDSDYNPESVEMLLKELGCKRISINDYYRQEKKSSEEIGVAIGLREGEKDTLFVVVQGTNYGAEFGGNLKVGEAVEYNGNHKGFSIARDTVLDFVKETVKEFGLNDDVRMLITGYSRGAAVTNLTAAYMCNRIAEGTFKDEFGVDIVQDDLYAFCFEPPLCGAPAPYTDGRYDNIVCVIDPNDIVTKIPLKQFGFVVYGRKVLLPSNNPDAVRRMKGYMDCYFGDGMSSYYNIDQFVPSPDAATLDEILERVLEKAYRSFGNRGFYVRNVEDDLSYTVFQVMTHLAALRSALGTFDPSDIRLTDVVPLFADKRSFLDRTSRYVGEFAGITGADVKTIMRMVGQTFDLLKRFDKADLLYVARMFKNNHRMLITPHYPKGPLSFLMMEDPNYRITQ